MILLINFVMLSLEDFRALSVEDSYKVYCDIFYTSQIFAARCADLNKRLDSFYDDYRMLYLSNSK